MDGKELLERRFHIQTDRGVRSSQGMHYESEGLLYTIVDVTNKEPQYLYELHQMSQHIIRQGDRKVAAFVPAAGGHFLVTEEEKDYAVLVSKPRTSRYSFSASSLFKFHSRGKTLPLEIKKASEFAQWKNIWEKQLETLEKSVSKMMEKQPDEPFASLVIESYPYYMGMAENAIQYVADTEMDARPESSDYGTICHKSFRPQVWEKAPIMRNPFDWAYDHRVRDVSEWLRSSYWEGTLLYRSRFESFLHEYQQAEPFSAFSWRMIYARLLFPQHYFDCAAIHASTSSLHVKKEKEEELKKYIKHSREYEQFLASFYERAGVRVSAMQIPEIAWLK
ncbi:spore coat putative kinase YutH [Bacillus xiapuensis]|uniref:spore coat putative kinase YutH n=1 Tax=Bacillus xiapuensis TaxID=2014075 RepID=UPI000C24E625|nr:spore coat protein YutH [Bacillus xiapuensis]